MSQARFPIPLRSPALCLWWISNAPPLSQTDASAEGKRHGQVWVSASPEEFTLSRNSDHEHYISTNKPCIVDQCFSHVIIMSLVRKETILGFTSEIYQHQSTGCRSESKEYYSFVLFSCYKHHKVCIVTVFWSHKRSDELNDKSTHVDGTWGTEKQPMMEHRYDRKPA